MAKTPFNNIWLDKEILSVIFGIGILAFSVILLLYLIPNYIDVPPIIENPMMSPRWLPNILSWLLIGMSILLIAQAIFPSCKDFSGIKKNQRGPWLRFLIMVLSLLDYVFLFEKLGSVISGIIAITLLFLVHPIRNIWVYGLAIIIPITVSFLFTEIMGVPLPVFSF